MLKFEVQKPTLSVLDRLRSDRLFVQRVLESFHLGPCDGNKTCYYQLPLSSFTSWCISKCMHAIKLRFVLLTVFLRQLFPKPENGIIVYVLLSSTLTSTDPQYALAQGMIFECADRHLASSATKCSPLLDPIFLCQKKKKNRQQSSLLGKCSIAESSANAEERQTGSHRTSLLLCS